MLIIVDIDGTIADWKAREKAAGANPGRENIEEYKAYIARLMDESKLNKDAMVPGMLRLLRALKEDCHIDIVYLTGRSEAHRTTTERWLFEHRFPFAPVFMREKDDWRGAVDYKLERVKIWTELHENVVALEDETDVADMMTKLGVTVLQVKYQEVA